MVSNSDLMIGGKGTPPICALGASDGSTAFRRRTALRDRVYNRLARATLESEGGPARRRGGSGVQCLRRGKSRRIDQLLSAGQLVQRVRGQRDDYGTQRTENQVAERGSHPIQLHNHLRETKGHHEPVHRHDEPCEHISGNAMEHPSPEWYADHDRYEEVGDKPEGGY